SWVNGYDMDGTVWEWVGDWYDATYYQQRVVNDPAGPASGTTRVLRGGSWFNDALCARGACRHVRYTGRPPDTRDEAIGIRIITPANAPGEAVMAGSPTAQASTQVAAAQCAGFVPSRMVIGRQARVSPGDPNRLRDEPNGKVIGKIPGEGVFLVVDGPRCTQDGTDGMAWWKVDYN